MDWEHKAAALDALDEISLKMRGPGDWYVSHNVEIKDGSILRGEYGNGGSPQEAFEDHWKKMVEEIGACYLVARAGRDSRRAVRWNGFMWADVSEPKPAAALACAETEMQRASA